MLKGKKIVLGITGSIAAYKACLLIRLLVKKGAEVQVVITPAGKEFITPLTLSTLSRRPVISEFFDRRDGSWNSHVDLGLWADAMLVAPCTASTLAKMANGIADNMLVTTYLSMKSKVFIAPAMDLDMYEHETTQKNLQLLDNRGDRIINPESGFLASGLEGKGRMVEPSRIVDVLENYFEDDLGLPADMYAEDEDDSPIEVYESDEDSYEIPIEPEEVYGEVMTVPGKKEIYVTSDGQRIERDLKGKKILITAGPTYERIDPVRYIGNYSTGKMGFALAEECRRRGAEVTLIAGPTALKCNSQVRRFDVETCDEMLSRAKDEYTQSDAAILCAAVADFRPETRYDMKIKREGTLTLKLVPNADIAMELGRQKKLRQKLVGFALETDNEEFNAVDKLKRKNFDFIVLNSMRNLGTCFGSDENQISIISKDGAQDFEKKPKTEVARDIINRLVEIL